MPYSYKDALRAKGIKRLPPYDKLRTSKANAKEGDRELIPNGSQPIAVVEVVETKRLTRRRKPPKLVAVN